MKLEKILLASLAAGMFAACSSDEPAPAPEPGSGMQGDGYVAVTINLPTTTTMSRAGNDDFNDGTANEYQVNTGALLLFAGSDEQSATFHSAYSLDLPAAVEDADNDNITTSYLTAVKVAKVENGNLYGLVMLNYTGVVQTIAADGKLNIYTEATGNTTKPFTGTFADLVKETSSRPFYNSERNDFFMTNAPLSSVAGGTVGTPAAANVTTLVSLTNSLKPTEEEAKAAPAGSFYVERAVAKATLSSEANSATIAQGNSTKTLPVVGKVSWLLDNTEPTSYIVRNMGDGSYLGFENTNRGRRFVGTAVMGTTSIQPATNLFRTYWCVDPHYGVMPDTESLATRDDYSDGDFTEAGTIPLYCHENTFTTAAQDHRHTTRAIVKVAFSVNNDGTGSTFYTVNGVQDKLYTDVKDAESFSLAFILNDDGIKAAIKDALVAGTSLAIDENNYDDYMTVSFARDIDGYRKVTAIKFKSNSAFAQAPVWTAEQEAALCQLTNSYYRIAEYTGGVNYYDLRFKHFAGINHNDAQDLAPWNPADITAATTEDASQSYPGADADTKWLGRYGMVRNNWYDVTVSAFNHLGEPALPSLDVDKTPDDEKQSEQWISFKVNVLSWAKRTQKHEF